MKLFSVTAIFLLVMQSACAKPGASVGIRSVDFSNFTYPWTTAIEPLSSFTLVRGAMEPTRDVDGKIAGMGATLAQTEYGDVTGDGKDEAMVFVSLQTGGSAIPGHLYVYTWKDEKPLLIWDRSTGDRADGGFRRAFANGGHLVLEVNHPDGARGDCCPVKFESYEYSWNGKMFRQTSWNIFPIPEKQ